MSRKRYQPERIVNLLRKIEVEIANGKKTAQAAREEGIRERTYYRCRKELGGETRPGEAVEGTGKREQTAEQTGGSVFPAEAGSARLCAGKLPTV